MKFPRASPELTVMYQTKHHCLAYATARLLLLFHSGVEPTTLSPGAI